MQFQLTILGSGSATPTAHRHPSSQYLTVSDRHFLIDCGEGAQMQLRRYHIRMQRISHVFISHLHGDHYFGLIGFITTQSLLGRTNELHIYSPPGLEKAIRILLEISDSRLSFELKFHTLEITGPTLLLEDKILEVYAFPLHHRIACFGYIFREKERERNMIRELVDYYKIPIPLIPRIKAGEDFVAESGTVIPNKILTKDPVPPRSYAYCSDTKYHESVVEAVKGVDLLYHEATFAEEMRERAQFTFHSTAEDAARVAKAADVGKLLIGHFSARYDNDEVLVKEAAAIFSQVEAAIEGNSYKI